MKTNTSNQTVAEELNDFFPYVGVYETCGLDPKNRLTIVAPLRKIRELRNDVIKSPESIFYYSLENEKNITFLLLRDSFVNQVDYSSFYMDSLDTQYRLRLEKVVADALPEKKDVVLVGYGDHIRMYSKQDWKKVNSEG